MKKLQARVSSGSKRSSERQQTQWAPIDDGVRHWSRDDRLLSTCERAVRQIDGLCLAFHQSCRSELLIGCDVLLEALLLRLLEVILLRRNLTRVGELLLLLLLVVVIVIEIAEEPRILIVIVHLWRQKSLIRVACGWVMVSH